MASAEPRLLESPHDLQALSRHLDRAFSLKPGQSFFADFPIWERGPSSDLARWGAWDGPELLASACARFARYKGPRGEFPVAIIGAVATAPEARGRGHASRLLERALSSCAERGVALVALWGSEHDLYRRFGFELCGMQTRTPLDALALPPGQRSGQRPIHYGWTASLLSLLAKRPAGLAIDLARDAAWLPHHRGVLWAWTGSTQAPTAYLAAGKGIDLPGIVHEWGGEPAALAELFMAFNLAHPGHAVFAGPSPETRPPGYVPAGPTENLCMCKVIAPEIVAAAFGAKTPKAPPNAKDWGPALFGPLPLWFWGLDSA